MKRKKGKQDNRYRLNKKGKLILMRRLIKKQTCPTSILPMTALRPYCQSLKGST